MSKTAEEKKERSKSYHTARALLLKKHGVKTLREGGISIGIVEGKFAAIAEPSP